MAKLFLMLASVSALLAVAFGAFGAHALKNRLVATAMATFETASQYHFYHSLALLAVGVIALLQPQTVMLRASGWLFFVGIVIFSGSLYVLSLSGIRWLGAITPIGGLAFMGGWLCLAIASSRLLD